MTRHSSFGFRMLEVSCYPILFLSAVVTSTCTLYFKLNLALSNMLFLCWTIFYLALMEKLIPYKNEWQATNSEWLRDGIYFIITMVGGAGAFFVSTSLVMSFSPQKGTLPLFLEALIAILVSSFGSYAFHRLSHVVPWLWLFHGVHHVEGKVNVGNNGVNHIIDVFFRRLVALYPLLFIGLSEQAIFISGIFSALQGYFAHANINVRFHFLNYLVVTPEQHRLHHSENLSEAGHYSVDIPLWDLLFRSYTWAPGKEAKKIGVVEPEKFPTTAQVLANLAHPFFRAEKKPRQ